MVMDKLNTNIKSRIEICYNDSCHSIISAKDIIRVHANMLSNLINIGTIIMLAQYPCCLYGI